MVQLLFQLSYGKHPINEGDKLEWIDDGRVIKVIPVPANPLQALRGIAKGEDLLDRLMRHRQEERRRE